MQVMRMRPVFGRAARASGLAVFAIAATAMGSGAAKADEAGCAALNGKLIAPTAFVGIAVPWGGQVSLATYMPAKDAAPGFCRVLGQVNPIDQHAHPVLFAVNLPDNWNGKAVQMGGNGLNGNVVTGLNAVPDMPPVIGTPLVRGYVTAGTDAGHPGGANIGEFMLIPEEFTNHAHAAYKKTHDAAVDLMQAYYKRKPTRFYYVGSSEGGREGLAVAQTYPADYDGVVSGVPVVGWVGMQLATYNQMQIVSSGGWLSGGKIALLQKTATDACDSLDNLKDGVVSRYGACAARIKYEPLRCSDGKDTGDTCLSDRQLLLVKTLHDPYVFPVALANGRQNYPGWGYGGEAQPQGFIPWRFPDKKPADGDLGDGQSVALMRYGVMRDAKYTGPIPWDTKAARIQELSSLMDMTNPDLSAFAARGGKLLIKENGSDYAKSPWNTIAYHQAMVDKMGAGPTDAFMRFYFNPGVVHIGIGQQGDGSRVPDKVDLLGALDAWVEGGPAPNQLTVTSYTAAAPFTAVAARPLCQYPLYPRYRRGDAKLAASFVCTAGGDSAK